MKFRKRPIVIEAIQWDSSITAASQIATLYGDNKTTMSGDHKSIAIVTLEGTMTAQLGDWIIQGVKGEIYPCKPDIFEQTYEPA